MNTAADLAAENIRLRRELAAAQDALNISRASADRAAAWATEQIQTLRRALDTASRHQHDNAELRGENTRLRAELEKYGPAHAHALAVGKQQQATIERVQQVCHDLPHEYASRILRALDGETP